MHTSEVKQVLKTIHSGHQSNMTCTNHGHVHYMINDLFVKGYLEKPRRLTWVFKTFDGLSWYFYKNLWLLSEFHEFLFTDFWVLMEYHKITLKISWNFVKSHKYAQVSLLGFSTLYFSTRSTQDSEVTTSACKGNFIHPCCTT